MKITGAGPKIAIPTFIYFFITIYIDSRNYPLFKITTLHYSVLLAAGILLMAAGAVSIVICARKLLRSFKAGVLMKDGPFIICRNPMYATYTFLVIPGLCLLFNSWLVLTTVLVNFILLKIFIKDEYRYLEQKFGDEYKEYLSRVWIKFI